MKKLLLLIFLISLTNLLKAQTNQATDTTVVSMTYKQAIDSIFGALDTTKITTGLIKERCLSFIDWENYNGSFQCPYATKDTAIELYYELYESKLPHIRMKTLKEIDSIATSYIDNNQVPLMLLNYNYQQFKNESFANGWIVREGFQLKDYTPAGLSPYTLKTAIAMGALGTYEQDLPIELILPSSLMLSNNNLASTSFLINLNDGSGFQSILPDQPLLLLPSSQEELSPTLLMINNTDTLTGNFIINRLPEVLMYSTPPVDSVKLTVEGQDNYYGVWLGCGNETIRKPIVIIEGYDPDNHRHLSSTNILNCSPVADHLYDNDIYDLMNIDGMADKLRNDGYDIIILNYKEGKNSLEYKSGVVEALINIINAQLVASGSNHELVMLGPSEASVVIRYTLARMEENGINHRVRLFLSFDGPHQGANLPIALQNYVKMLDDCFPQDYVSLFFGALVGIHGVINNLFQDFFLGEATAALYAKATEQLLTNSVSDPDHTEHNLFYNKLRQTNNGNGYPVLSRNVAISEGSMYAANQGFEAGTFLYNFKLFVPSLLDVTGIGTALADNTESEVYSGVCAKYLPGLPQYPFIFYNKTIKVKSLPYDNAPGGNTGFVRLVKEGIPEELENKVFFALIHDDQQFPVESFIPLTSALDIQNTNNLFYDVSGVTGEDGLAFKHCDYTSAFSPFDAIYVLQENTKHVICGTTPGIIQFTFDEIMPEYYFVQNMIIDEPTDFEGAKTVTIGREVSRRFAFGDVSISASSKVTAGNSIFLKPGTKLSSHNTAGITLKTREFPVCEFDKKTAAKSTYVSFNNDFQHNIKSKSTDVKNLYFNWNPNPSSDIAQVEYHIASSSVVEISFYSITGVLLKEIVSPVKLKKGTYQKAVNLSEYNKGIYVCVMKVDGLVVQNQKVIIN